MESLEDQLKQQNEKLYTLLMERSEKYEYWKDFNERGCPSKGALSVLNDKTKEVNRCQGVVNRLKRDIGYTDAEIKSEDMRRIMNPEANERCKRLLLSQK